MLHTAQDSIFYNIAGFMNETNGEKEAEVSEKLGEIVLELKKRVPQYSVFPTEKFFVPVDGVVVFFTVCC